MASTVRNWFSLSSIRNWFSNINPLKTKALPQHEDFLTKTLGKYEPYVIYLQNILIWDDPIISSFSILTVNMLFWIVLNFELKFYGVIFTTLLVWMCCEAWFDHVWPEISVPSEEKREQVVYTPQHPSGVLSVPEISSYVMQAGKLVKRYCLRLHNLRADQPGMFCCEVGSVFALLAVIGRLASGPCLAYVAAMTVMSAPGVWIHVLPPAVKIRVAEIFTSLRDTQGGLSELEDLVPESTHENLQLFHRAGHDGDDGSDRDDSTEFTFDAADSPMSPRAEDSSSESGGDGFRFRGSHFDGSDSDGDPEDTFSRGMEFTTTRGAAPSEAAAAMLGNLGSLLASAMTLATAPQLQLQPQRRRSSSSDLEDFEIIDPAHESLS